MWHGVDWEFSIKRIIRFRITGDRSLAKGVIEIILEFGYIVRCSIEIAEESQRCKCLDSFSADLDTLIVV